MIPLRDNIPSRSRPVVSYLIIASCVVVWLAEITSPDHLLGFVFIPHQLVSPEAWQQFGLPAVLLRVLTSMFMHDPGGPLHLIMNMLFLWVFGDNVEDRLGHFVFAVFYLVCGTAATLAHSLLSGFSDAPILGASGAIAGVLGAYFVFFRTARVRTLVPIFLFITVIEIPAVIFLGLWFVYQLISGLGSLGGAGGGVAFWAHIGGFLAGMVLGPAFAPGGRKPRPPRVVGIRYD